MALDRLIVANAQMDPKIFDIEGNLIKIEALTLQAKEEAGADLIVFPEAAITGYCFQNLEEARRAAIREDGPELKRLQALSKEQEITIVVGTVEAREEEVYNTVFLLEPDGALFHYHKSHLPFLGVDRFVKAGDVPCAVFDTRFGKIGMIVCYELRFPESARLAALEGARIILHPNNQPVGGESQPEFFTRSRACENRVHFICCNRCGTERNFSFIGRSQIVDCYGGILAECGKEEEIIYADLDLTLSEKKDIISAPGERELYLLRHRRWDIYGKLSEKPDEQGYLTGHR